MAKQPPSKEFGKRRPAAQQPESRPPAKRSGHVALLVMGTLAVGTTAYTLLPRQNCDPPPPGAAAPAQPGSNCSSSRSSSGSGGSRSSFFSSDSAGHSSSGTSSDAGSGVSRGGFGSSAHGFFGGG
jgi:hypothetical protein